MKLSSGYWPELRAWFGLSMAELGRCFGLSRNMMWQVETGRRSLPLAALLPHLALTHARQATPLAPTPEPLDAPLLRRQARECRHRAGQLAHRLAQLDEQAAPARRSLAAIAVVAASYAAAGTPAPPWLTHFEQHARGEIHRSGSTAQALLRARHAAMLAEAAELERLLAAAPTA